MFLEKTLAERVIIKPLVAKKSKGGIILSQDERSQAINADRGEVFLIGPMAWYDLPEKPDIKVGDKVYYSKYGAKTLKPEGSEDFFIICNDKDILVGYKDD